jgi:alkylation response protein AidB-like acyl-CoA dehydrogenase
MSSAEPFGRAAVETRIDDLLSAFPPDSVQPREFWGAQFDYGLAWVHFRAGDGGLDAEPGLQEVVDARLRTAGAPSNLLHNFVGLGMAAPTISSHGTADQRQRYLRKIFTCEEVWCQLFSEPTAGSDLASVSTLALKDGEGWRISGHKVWTTLAHVSRFGLLLARTRPDVAKQAGLTFFVCDMRAPGVTVLPLRQLSGDAEFNEVLLAEVYLPDALRVGDIDHGWSVAISTLMSERLHNGNLATNSSAAIERALRLWRESRPDSRTASRRDDLVQLWVKSEVTRLLATRAQEGTRGGRREAEGSLVKLAVGELPQQIYDLCLDLAGMQGLLVDTYEMHQPTTMGQNTWDASSEGILAKAFLDVRSHTIGGGTSEMQRNAIGERVLGLPREPNVERGRTWAETRAL